MIASALVIVGVALAANAGASDSPERAAENFLNATVNLDGTALIDLTCGAKQQDVLQSGGFASSLLLYFGLPEIKSSLKHVAFETASVTGNSAQVRVTGSLTLSVLALAQAQKLDTTFQMVREDGAWKYCGEIASK